MCWGWNLTLRVVFKDEGVEIMGRKGKNEPPSTGRCLGPYLEGLKRQYMLFSLLLLNTIIEFSIIILIFFRNRFCPKKIKQPKDIQIFLANTKFNCLQVSPNQLKIC